jgi:hypothetical protein
MSQLQGYGFVSDSDESLKTKSGAKFGGNFGVATLAKFAYNANVAKEGQPAREAIEIEVKIGDRSYKEWLNPVDRVVDKNNAEITDKASAEYIAGFNALIVQQNATVTHYLKAVGVTEDALRASFATPPVSFADYAQRVCALLPIGYNNKPLDLFLEYQWNFGKKQDGSLQDKTYPTLPKNMKGGYFIVPAQPGVWIEKKDEMGNLEDGKLVYINSNGQKHPFERDANFMSGNKGTQQVMGAAAATSPMGATAGVPSGTW